MVSLLDIAVNFGLVCDFAMVTGVVLFFLGGDDFSNQVYVQNLVLNPQENDLYCSVIYLAAGDYHRFHSPTCWRLLLRRHFAGKNLYILNHSLTLS